MKELKIFTARDGTVLIMCPYCDISKRLTSEKLAGRKKLKVHCPCGNAFKVDIELRKKFRKKTHLEGSYINRSQGHRRGKIVVTDLSVGGLTFVSSDGIPVRKNDELRIEFTLDDASASRIKKNVLVKWINGLTAGCEFSEPPEYNPDKTLGFYLLP